MSYLISLIVPFYKNLNTISPTLESIKNSINHIDQNVIEILFVNNNSSDGTEKFVLDFLPLIPGSRLVYESKQGVSHARNSGILASTGEYIAFLDADDTLEESYFSDIIYGLNLNPDILFLRHDNFSESQTSMVLPVSDILLNHLKGWWNCQFVFKKSLSYGLKFEGACFEDFGFFPLVLNRARNCMLFNRGLYRYNDNSTSMTKRPINWRIAELQGQFDRLNLLANELDANIYKRVQKDFYEHISLLRAIAGRFPVLGMKESLAFLMLTDEWRVRLDRTKTLLRLNASTLYKPFKRLMSWQSR